MYETMLVADSPAPAATPDALPSLAVTLDASGMAAAAAALSVLQSTAAAGSKEAQLMLPSSINSVGTNSTVPAGLSGMLKSWAAETGSAMVSEQHAEGASALKLTSTSGIRQPTLTEQESR
jgi:hypothetical protein